INHIAADAHHVAGIEKQDIVSLQGREDFGRDLLHRPGNDSHSPVKTALWQPIGEGINRDEFSPIFSRLQVGAQCGGQDASAEPATNFDNVRRSAFPNERVSDLSIHPLEESIVVVIATAIVLIFREVPFLTVFGYKVAQPVDLLCQAQIDSCREGTDRPVSRLQRCQIRHGPVIMIRANADAQILESPKSVNCQRKQSIVPVQFPGYFAEDAIVPVVRGMLLGISGLITPRIGRADWNREVVPQGCPRTRSGIQVAHGIRLNDTRMAATRGGLQQRERKCRSKRWSSPNIVFGPGCRGRELPPRYLAGVLLGRAWALWGLDRASFAAWGILSAFPNSKLTCHN